MNKFSPCEAAWFIGNSLFAAQALVESRLSGDESGFGLDRSRLICLLEQLATMAEELGNDLSEAERRDSATSAESPPDDRRCLIFYLQRAVCLREIRNTFSYGGRIGG